MSAAQTAVYAALQAALPAGTPLYDYVPGDSWDGTPRVQLGLFTRERGAAGFNRVTFEVIVWSAERSRKAAQVLLEAVIAALKDTALPAQAGTTLSKPLFQSSSDGPLGDSVVNRMAATFLMFEEK